MSYSTTETIIDERKVSSGYVRYVRDHKTPNKHKPYLIYFRNNRGTACGHEWYKHMESARRAFQDRIVDANPSIPKDRKDHQWEYQGQEF